MSSTSETNGIGTEFKRRDGTAGISGHLYETKLLSLLYFRATHDETIKEFQLASNVANIGAFDDICLKVSVKAHDKPVCLFIQAKHRENKKKTLKIDWAPYFISYLKIRQHFDPNKTDLFFGQAFDETECYFVIYTTAKDGFNNDPQVQSSLCSSVHDLINTGGTAKQPYKTNEENVEFLCEIAIKEQMALLAERIATYVMGEKKFQMMNDDDELMIRYHVILQQKVLDVSKIQPGGYRTATFRKSFLDSNEEYLSVFKDTLYKEILKKRKIKITDVSSLLSEFLADRTNAQKLSKLIVTVITYSDQYDVLYINKQYAKNINPQQLNEVNVSPCLVKQAVQLAAEEILLSPQLELRVPATFGNKDLTVKNMKRINHLTSEIIGLLDTDTSRYSKIVTIDESFKEGFLDLNGGIAGAIGNIFVHDDNMKCMKVTSNEESLGTFAKSLYQKLKEEIEKKNNDRSTINKIPDLLEYKFNFKFKKCPKLLLRRSEHEKQLVRDFLNKLLIYSSQDDEKGVEDKLRDEIDENLRLNDFLQAKTESMFLKYHNEVQTWWMIPEKAPYLNKGSQILNKSSNNIILDPLLSSISEPYTKKMKKYDYIFTEDAVRSLNLLNQPSSTMVVTENCVLTVVKVMQHLKEKEHVVLDFESIVNLPTKKRNVVRRELTNTEKVLIFVCNNIPEKGKRTFLNIAEAVGNKRIIIITKTSFREILQEYFRTADFNIILDENIRLIDMNEDTEMKILKSGSVKLQSIEVELEQLVNGWTYLDLKSWG